MSKSCSTFYYFTFIFSRCWCMWGNLYFIFNTYLFFIYLLFSL